MLQDQQRKISTLKSAPNAIHSTQDSRKLTELTDVLISSTENTVSTNKKMWLQIRLRLTNLNLFFKITIERTLCEHFGIIVKERFDETVDEVFRNWRSGSHGRRYDEESGQIRRGSEKA